MTLMIWFVSCYSNRKIPIPVATSCIIHTYFNRVVLVVHCKVVPSSTSLTEEAVLSLKYNRMITLNLVEVGTGLVALPTELYQACIVTHKLLKQLRNLVNLNGY